MDGTANAAVRAAPRLPVRYRTLAVLVSAGFRRYSTYRQATVAGLFTNIVFGFLNCYVLLAVANGHGGTAAGYAGRQLVTFVWINQGLLATVGIWGDTVLADRIRTGEVVADLIRPIHPVLTYLGTDLGRAGFAALSRFLVPIILGGLAFHLQLPRRPATYLLFLISVALATLLSFACRYLVNATTFWLLDARGPQVAWMLSASLLGGLYFPLRFLPGPLVAVLWLGTPFPSLLQGPADVGVERVGTVMQFGIIAVQVLWVVIAFGGCLAVQRRAERRMVMQGG